MKEMNTPIESASTGIVRPEETLAIRDERSLIYRLEILVKFLVL